MKAAALVAAIALTTGCTAITHRYRPVGVAADVALVSGGLMLTNIKSCDPPEEPYGAFECADEGISNLATVFVAVPLLAVGAALGLTAIGLEARAQSDAPPTADARKKTEARPAADDPWGEL